MLAKSVDISIIVPVLNEAAELAGLCANLAGQQGVSCEIIFCDGGSVDGSLPLLKRLANRLPHQNRVITASPGRGSQMNAGAEVALGEFLLFLHADSRFGTTDTLATALAIFRQAAAANMIVAGRFRLSFRRTTPRPSLTYRYYECKARLDRVDCIRGDQGFLVSRSTFRAVGEYDTSLPYLEDIRLAEAVAKRGHWVIIPVEISTSARRFEAEGLFERQTVNAIITTAVAAGWNELLVAMPGLYRSSCTGDRLHLFPVLDRIKQLIAEQPPSWRRSFWHSTGHHVADNSWQIFFWFDVRRAFRNGSQSPEDYWYCLYRQRLSPLFESALAVLVAQLLTRFWFRLMLHITRSR